MQKHKSHYFKIAYKIRIVYSSVIQLPEGEYFFPITELDKRFEGLVTSQSQLTPSMGILEEMLLTVCKGIP